MMHCLSNRPFFLPHCPGATKFQPHSPSFLSVFHLSYGLGTCWVFCKALNRGLCQPDTFQPQPVREAPICSGPPLLLSHLHGSTQWSNSRSKFSLSVSSHTPGAQCLTLNLRHSRCRAWWDSPTIQARKWRQEDLGLKTSLGTILSSRLACTES